MPCHSKIQQMITLLERAPVNSSGHTGGTWIPIGQLSVGALPSPHPKTFATAHKNNLYFSVFIYFYALKPLGYPTEVQS